MRSEALMVHVSVQIQQVATPTSTPKLTDLSQLIFDQGGYVNDCCQGPWVHYVKVGQQTLSGTYVVV